MTSPQQQQTTTTTTTTTTTSGTTPRTKRKTKTQTHTTDETLLAALRALRDGDFTVRLATNDELAQTFNEVVELNDRMRHQFSNLREAAGNRGDISSRIQLETSAGTPAQGGWEECTASVNGLVSDLTRPTSEVLRVISAVAKGDLSQTIATDGEKVPQGEFLKVSNIVNEMVDQLSSFTSEVIRVAREVGTEGRLGGQAQVPTMSGGVWRDLTDNVNTMAANLTGQVRAIAEVTTAVATGDLSKKITVDVSGEILELKNTINTMVDQLNSFASEVTRVAKEVGTEGRLGGQAQVEGVGGVWKDLTDNVNFMAANLTGQVRAIAEVTTAVATGDLSKKITIDVKGEILELKVCVIAVALRVLIFSFPQRTQSTQWWIN